MEARENLDEGRIRADDFDKAKVKEKTRGEKLEDRYAKEDKTGFRRFDLDANEARRNDRDEWRSHFCARW